MPYLKSISSPRHWSKTLTPQNGCGTRQFHLRLTQVVGRSLISRKTSTVSWSSVASVSQWSGCGCGSGGRVYVDRFTNGMRGSRARKFVMVRSQVTLVTWSIIHFLFTRMSVAPRHQYKRNIAIWQYKFNDCSWVQEIQNCSTRKSVRPKLVVITLALPTQAT